LKEDTAAAAGCGWREEAQMLLRLEAGLSWATLRGVLTVLGLSACTGTTAGTGSLASPTSEVPKQDVSALQTDWDLVSLQEAGGPVLSVPQGRFSALFGADADLFIQADCNVCSAGFTAESNGSLEVKGPIPCTLAYCTTAPLDTRYLVLLEAADSWSMGVGTLELLSEAGGLVFERAGA
jgi:heat shock protein HslJ